MISDEVKSETTIKSSESDNSVSTKSHPCFIVGHSALIADDEMSIRTLNSAMLSRMGMQPRAAKGGEEALLLFAAHNRSVTVAILDIDMPGMDGIDLCKKLRRTRPDLPVVFASGYAGPNLKTRIEPLQPSIFLPKPYGVRDFQRAVLDAVCKTKCDRHHDCVQNGPPV